MNETTLKSSMGLLEFANEMNTKQLIHHVTNLLYELSDSRLHIENMPKVGLDGEAMIGYSSEQIEELIEDGGMSGFRACGEGGVSFGLDYKEYVQGFMWLEPRVFHLSDRTLGEEKDEHLNICELEYDFKYSSQCIDIDPFKVVTVETPRFNQMSLNEDIQNVNKLR